jgi:C4-type Zn-finger protein
MTHGYVGFSQQEEYIACPVCGEKANESEEYDEELPFY